MRRLLSFIRKLLLRMAKVRHSDDQIQQPANELNGSQTPASVGTGEFDPDHPISPGYKEDRLGFRAVANELAKSLLTQATSHGFVVSIEGAWGSGKSSLVNLLADELNKSQKHAPETVRFAPWLVGDRDGMLAELMSDLASAVESIQASGEEQEKDLKAETKELAGQLRGYALTLSRRAAPIARLAGVLGVPGGEVIGKALEATSEATTAISPGKPLPQVKEELTKGLHKLGRRIVVIVDDLDRLEPHEAVEIMRLIRAVADFPNVIYVLCYDPKILEESLKDKLSVSDGTAFLEKIVQVRFNVPKPEAFDLRRWFQEECQTFHNSVCGEQLTDDQMHRLHMICSVEGELLETPRDVVRALNGIKLHWPPISDKVDYPDLVWLQMVRIENQDLYFWIEKYLNECAAVSEGARIFEMEKVKLAEELLKHIKPGNIGSARSIWTFKEFVPGVQPGDNVEDKDRLFNLSDETEVSSFERDRRLGSPQHSRYYFAFSKPAGALDDTELSSFIASAEEGEDLEELCTALIQEKRPQGGTKFDLLIDRLNRFDEAALTDKAVRSILMALANCMDKAVEESGRGEWGVRWAWNNAIRLFKKLIAKFSEGDRVNIIRNVFGTGKAIGWLMSELLRGEVFAHGRYGDRAKPEESRLFSDKELDLAIGLMLDRLKSTDRNRIIDTPEVLSLMYGWKQAGDEAGVLEWVREQRATDAGFLKLLSACRGWMQSDKTYYPLNRRDLKHFMNFDEAVERLKHISEDPECTQDERALAEELLKAAEMGKDD